MFSNHVKIALRYLLRHKGYTLINLIGLSIGITCCVLILLFVKSEFSFDQFHDKADRIYRSWVREKYENQEDIIDIQTPLPLAGALQASFPEIESSCRIFAVTGVAKIEKASFPETVTMVDSTFFNIFDFPLIEGNRNQPFAGSNSIILTETTARKYFGNSSALGKNIELQLGGDTILCSVSGIVKTAREESSIKFTALIPSVHEKDLFSEGARRSWFNVSPETYVLLRKDVKTNTLAAKFPSMVKQYLGQDYKEGMYTVNLQRITNIHLDNSLPQGLQPISNPAYSYILLTIAILILVVACINFITLSIGRSAARAKEVGVRKVLGAGQSQLIGQYWGEAILLTILSTLIALLFSAVLLKPFNELINRELAIRFDLTFAAMCLLIIVVVGLIAGIYPALVLSGFKPVEVLKGKFKLGNDRGLLRKGLITGQFVASIAMIVCTIIISKQLNYVQQKDLGYKKDQIIVVQTHKPRIEGTKLAQLYRNELLKQPRFAGASISLMSFSETPWIELGYNDDKNTYRDFQFNAVDPYFIKTMGIKILQGRDFSSENPSDYTSAMLVNEALVKKFGIKDPIGQSLPGNKVEQRIIGVVKDFNYQSLHTAVQPLAMVITPDSFFRQMSNINFSSPIQPRISIRLQGTELSAALNDAKAAWTSVAGDQEFDYSFLDENVAKQYRQEQRVSAIVQVASGLSILIACIGLFGLVTLTVVRRTKEIGIRKVLGASAAGIVRLLLNEFLMMVIVAALIAFPLSWWAMDYWLKDFAYRTSVPWWIFAVAGFTALVIATITVSLQAVKAALTNPVKSLRIE